jgi:Uma2 family endonuclease
MIAQPLVALPQVVVYPESDGKPMAENTRQMRWIVVLYGGLCALFRDQANVFVAADLFWYAEEGQPEVRTAPDVLVAFGRPKGDRGSYQQWVEGGVAPQVVFEVLSPGNTPMEMADKLAFYDDHGVEEYYLYDPDSNQLAVYIRQGTVLRRVRGFREWVSPRLGIRFDPGGKEMVVYRPDGQLFRTFEEVMAELEAERQRRQDAEQRATDAEQRAVRLAERLRQAGLDPNA